MTEQIMTLIVLRAYLAGLAVAWAGNWLIANWNKRVFPEDKQ